MLKTLSVDGRDGGIAVHIEGQAATVKRGPLTVEAPSVALKMGASWPGISLASLLKEGAQRPPVASLLRAKLDADIEQASASALRVSDREFNELVVRQLKVTANMPEISGSIDRMGAKETGYGRVGLQGKMGVGFTGVSIPTSCTIDGDDLSASVLAPLQRAESIVLPTTRFDGKLTLMANLLDASSLRIEALETR